MKQNDLTKMENNNLEDYITALSAEYHQLIGKDHHKDRDCHWYIETRWSYGMSQEYVVCHFGYVFKHIEQRFTTYRGALLRLITLLNDAIENIEGE